MLLRIATIPLISIMTIMFIIMANLRHIYSDHQGFLRSYSSSSGHPSQPSHPHRASGGADAKAKLHGFVIGFISYGYVICAGYNIHTYVHTYVHMDIRTYVHMYYIRTYVLHMYMRTCMHTYMHAYIHT